MDSGKCACCKTAYLCPFSFGVGLGVTCMLVAFLWATWVIYYGYPAMMSTWVLEPMTWGLAVKCAAWHLLKGFIIGLVLAFFYNMTLCCTKKWCCRKCEKCAETCR